MVAIAPLRTHIKRTPSSLPLLHSPFATLVTMSGYGEQDNGQWSSQYPPIVPSSQPTTSQHHHIPSSQTLYTQYSAQGPYPSNSPISQDAYPPITSYSAYPSSTSNNEHSSNVYSHSLTSTSHAHTQLSTSHPPSAARAFEQRSVVFRFSTTNAGIHNSRVYDSYGKSPFDVTSRGQKTTLQSADGRPIAVIYWDYAQPVMVYRGSRFKCMDWFPYNREKR